MIKYICEKCKSKLETGDALASKREPCPVCGFVNVVPKSKQQLREERAKAKELERARQAAILEEQKRQQMLAQEIKKTEWEQQNLLAAKKAEEENRVYAEAVAFAKANPQVSKNWFCFVEGKEWGPMPEARLQAWISEKRVRPEGKVRVEGGSVAVRAGDLPEIFVFPQQAPPPVQDPTAPQCPKCGSTHLSSNKKGMDKSDACCGALLIGPLGLLCGLSDKVVVTCLACGHQWNVG